MKLIRKENYFPNNRMMEKINKEMKKMKILKMKMMKMMRIRLKENKSQHQNKNKSNKILIKWKLMNKWTNLLLILFFFLKLMSFFKNIKIWDKRDYFYSRSLLIHFFTVSSSTDSEIQCLLWGNTALRHCIVGYSFYQVWVINMIITILL